MNDNKISLSGLTLLTVGAMVGSAIFSLSGLTISQAGGFSLFSWLIAGAILLFYGLLCAYLAKQLSKDNGMFHFAADTLGKTAKSKRILGTISSLTYFIGCFAGVVFSTQYIGYYFMYLFPEIPEWSGTVFAIFTVVLSALLKLIKVRLMSIIQGVLTVILAFSLLAYSIYILSSGTFSFEHIFASNDAQGALFSVPIAMLAYGSIVAPALMFGRVREPQRNIKRAQIFAMIITLALYLLAIFATLGVVNSPELQDAPYQVYTPFNFAITLAGGPSAFGAFINIAAILALLTTQIVVLSLAVDSITIVSEEGIFPRKLSNKTLTTVLFALIVAVLAFFPAISDFVVYFGGFFNAVFVALICLSAGHILWRKQHRIIALISLLVCAILVVCYIAGAL